MRPAEDILEIILSRFRERGIAQVDGCNRFWYVRETDNALIIRRENGKEARIPTNRLIKAIEIIRVNTQIYNDGPSGLRPWITHINSPIWSLLHLATLGELLE